MYESFGISAATRGVDCRVVEWVKHGTLRWFGHMIKMNDGYYVKGKYEGSIEGGVVRRNTSEVDQQNLLILERGDRLSIEGAKREFLNRESWRRFFRGQPF